MLIIFIADEHVNFTCKLAHIVSQHCNASIQRKLDRKWEWIRSPVENFVTLLLQKPFTLSAQSGNFLRLNVNSTHRNKCPAHQLNSPQEISRQRIQLTAKNVPPTPPLRILSRGPMLDFEDLPEPCRSSSRRPGAVLRPP